MRPLAPLLAVPLALVLAAPASAAKSFKGTYKADITSAKYTDNNTAGDSVGDQLTFKISVRESRKKHPRKLGRGTGSCDRVEGRAWACTDDIAWTGGHVLSGWTMVDGQKVLRQKVTGGTGLFASASGEIKLTRLIAGNPMYWRADVKIIL